MYPTDIQLGGHIWDEVVLPLKSKGYSVYSPTLSDEYENCLTDHIQQICHLINHNQLSKVILVGHSYGGMVITGVADKLSKNIGKIVYVDAALPKNKQSLFDLLKLANLDPSIIIKGTPKAYTEKIKLKKNTIEHLPKYYIRCMESEFISVTALAKKQILANSYGWSFQEINTGHLPMATVPSWLACYLLELLGS